MSVWNLWREIDAREAAKPKPRVEREDWHHASSSIQATAWLIRYAPERLSAWLDRHADGLERAAREAMA